jgi:hypothetical protein
MGGLLNCAQKEKQDCIEMLKMLDNHSEEWDTAMEEYKVAKSEVRSFMTQLSHLATLNDGKRSADEEITDNFVESLRQGRPAIPATPAMPSLHQPTQDTITEGPFSQMVDLQPF